MLFSYIFLSFLFIYISILPWFVILLHSTYNLMAAAPLHPQYFSPLWNLQFCHTHFCFQYLKHLFNFFPQMFIHFFCILFKFSILCMVAYLWIPTNYRHIIIVVVVLHIFLKEIKTTEIKINNNSEFFYNFCCDEKNI